MKPYTEAVNDVTTLVVFSPSLSLLGLIYVSLNGVFTSFKKAFRQFYLLKNKEFFGGRVQLYYYQMFLSGSLLQTKKKKFQHFQLYVYLTTACRHYRHRIIISIKRAADVIH